MKLRCNEEMLFVRKRHVCQYICFMFLVTILTPVIEVEGFMMVTQGVIVLREFCGSFREIESLLTNVLEKLKY
jgi:hypothetical protein